MSCSSTPSWFTDDYMEALCRAHDVIYNTKNSWLSKFKADWTLGWKIIMHAPQSSNWWWLLYIPYGIIVILGTWTIGSFWFWTKQRKL
jgi:hypothetical protein